MCLCVCVCVCYLLSLSVVQLFDLSTVDQCSSLPPRECVSACPSLRCGVCVCVCMCSVLEENSGVFLHLL